MHAQIGVRALRVRPSLLSHGQSRNQTLALLSSTVSRNHLIPSRTPRRHASSSSAAQEQPKPRTTATATATLQSGTTPLDNTTSVPAPINPDVSISTTLNPPASTRPPPLDLPVRDPKASFFSHAIAVAKAYLPFFKSGIKAIFTNRRLLSEAEHMFKDGETSVRPTRAAILLRERTRHDLARIPIFAMLLVVAGEMTPLVVVWWPKLSPYTCRIPLQVQKLRTMMAERRAASHRNIRYITDPKELEKAASAHILRALDVGSRFWDKAGFNPPFAQSQAEAAVARLVDDDFMINEGGGVAALVDDEVLLACDMRGMDVRGKSVEEMRSRLQEWIVQTTKGGREDGAKTVRELLLADDQKS